MCFSRRCVLWFVLQALTGYILPYRKSAVSSDHLLLKAPAHGAAAAELNRRICSSWNQCRTGTGRLSCSAPNLQALPRASAKQMPTVQGEAAAAVEPQQDLVDLTNLEDEDDAADLAPPVSGCVAAISAGEARTVSLPIDINMRDAIVPTPASAVAAMYEQRFAVWNKEKKCVEIQVPNQEEDAAYAEPAPSSANDPASSSSASASSSRSRSSQMFSQLMCGLVSPKCARIDSWHQRDSSLDGEERIFLCADYSQMEVRLLAQLSKEHSLIKLFNPSYMQGGAASQQSGASSDAFDIYKLIAARVRSHTHAHTPL